jgi:hypothetical protein
VGIALLGPRGVCVSRLQPPEEGDAERRHDRKDGLERAADADVVGKAVAGGAVEDEPDDWEYDRTKRYSVRELRGVQFDPAGRSLVLVSFQTLTDFPVDVYTVSLESAAAVSTGDVDIDSVAIDALSFPGMDRGANLAELADGSYAVFIDNTGDIGPATPPSTDAVADVSLRIAYT